MKEKSGLIMAVILCVACSFIIVSLTLRNNPILSPNYTLPSDKCIAWAFGERSGPTYIMYMDDVWNKEHPDLPQLKGTDLVSEAWDKIANECKKRGL